MRLGPCAALLGLLAGPGLADAPPPRCALLGQMAASSWLEMLGALSQKDAAAIDPAVTRLDALSGTYASLGCDVVALAAAMDCVLTQSGAAAPQDLARTCMQGAGLTAAE